MSAFSELDFYATELLETSLYPVALVQYRYGPSWFAIANADEAAPNGAVRAAWALSHGPNANGAGLDPWRETGGQEPAWIGRGQSPDEAVLALLAKARK